MVIESYEGLITTIISSSLLSAIVTAIIGYFLAVRGRLRVEIKSKQRQEWINTLRKEISLVLSKSYYSVFDLRTQIDIQKLKNPDNMAIDDSDFIKIYSDIYSSILQIRLFLNTTKKDSKETELENLLNNLNCCLIKITDKNLQLDSNGSSDEIDEIKEFKQISLDIINTSKSIFKAEWERIKKGK